MYKFLKFSSLIQSRCVLPQSAVFVSRSASSASAAKVRAPVPSSISNESATSRMHRNNNSIRQHLSQRHGYSVQERDSFNFDSKLLDFNALLSCLVDHEPYSHAAIVSKNRGYTATPDICARRMLEREEQERKDAALNAPCEQQSAAKAAKATCERSAPKKGSELQIAWEKFQLRFDD